MKQGELRRALLGVLLLAAGCATQQFWQRWPAEAQRRYIGLSYIAADSALAAYCAQPDPAAMDAWYRTYWSAPHGGADSAEHRRRIEYAWGAFGKERCHLDDRTRIWVQHGQPVERYRSNSIFRMLDDKMTLARNRRWEVWLYPDDGLYVDFIEFNERYQVWATTDLDRRRPVAFFRREDGAASGPPVDSARLRNLDCAQARFRAAAGDSVRWECYWRIPLAEVNPGRCRAEFRIRDGAGVWRSENIWYRPVFPGHPAADPYVFGQRNFTLPPGHYRLEVTVCDSAGTVAYRASAEDELLSYQPGIQQSSDVELALFQDTTMISPDFQKGKYKRVIPQLAPAIAARQPYFIYYEVYNLLTDGAGSHHVKVGLQSLLTQQSGTLSVQEFTTGTFTFVDTSSTFRSCQCLHPMDWPPGDYTLLITVEDILSGRTTKLAKNVRIGD